MNEQIDQDMTRKGRHVAMVIAGTMVVWFGTGLLGAAMGWPGRFALLTDLAALAALIYAFVNIYQIWRLRQNRQDLQNRQG